MLPSNFLSVGRPGCLLAPARVMGNDLGCGCLRTSSEVFGSCGILEAGSAGCPLGVQGSFAHAPGSVGSRLCAGRWVGAVRFEAWRCLCLCRTAGRSRRPERTNEKRGHLESTYCSTEFCWEPLLALQRVIEIVAMMKSQHEAVQPALMGLHVATQLCQKLTEKQTLSDDAARAG